MRWFDAQEKVAPDVGDIMQQEMLEVMRTVLSHPYLWSGTLIARDMSGVNFHCSTFRVL